MANGLNFCTVGALVNDNVKLLGLLSEKELELQDKNFVFAIEVNGTDDGVKPVVYTAVPNTNLTLLMYPCHRLLPDCVLPMLITVALLPGV